MPLLVYSDKHWRMGESICGDESMKIAVMADGRTTDCKVSETFADASWLLIADMDKLNICECIPKEGNPDGRELATAIAKLDCESVICGDIDKIPFEILAEKSITRSRGNGLTVSEALACEALLDLITDYTGGEGCPSSQEPHSKQKHIHEHGPDMHGCTHECIPTEFD